MIYGIHIIFLQNDVTDISTARETGRGPAANLKSGRPEAASVWSSRLPVPGMLDLNTGTSALLTGNLEGLSLPGMDLDNPGNPGLLQHSSPPAGSHSQQTGTEKIVLLKPEDFMKKTVRELSEQKGEVLTSTTVSGIVESRKPNLKRTPRHYAGEDDQVWGLPPVSDFRIVEPRRDSRDGQGIMRHTSGHTPREMWSPRRAAPPGILHNKVSDSDADVSPLNTARSRGTVTFASPKSPSPEEEIINIRDRLKHFSQQKNKLRYNNYFQLYFIFMSVNDYVLYIGFQLATPARI